MTGVKVRLILAWTLTAISFLGSWSHCYDRVLAAGQPELLSALIATMPEVSVVLALLAYMNGERSAWVTLTGLSAFAFTLTANLMTAQPGVWSHIVAAWPAWSAITALKLAHPGEHMSAQPAREHVSVSAHVQVERLSEQVMVGERAPVVSAQVEEVSARVSDERTRVSAHIEQTSAQAGGERAQAERPTDERAPAVSAQVTSERVAWVIEQGVPDTALIVERWGVSAATARRYRARALTIQGGAS